MPPTKITLSLDHNMSIIRLCLLVVLWSVPAFAQDPCATLASKNTTVITIEDAFGCFRSFPITPAMKRNQADALKSYFELYPYLDIAKSSSAPLFPSSIDLLPEIDRIANDPTITSEFEYQSRLVDLVTSLHDAHSFYQPSCFTSVRFFQPWVIAARYPEGLRGQPELYLRETVVDGSYAFSEYAREAAPFLSGLMGEFERFWRGALGREAREFVGYSIVSIDGTDAATYVQRFADRLAGVSREPDSRFNLVLPTTAYVNGSMRLLDGLIYRVASPPSDFSAKRTYRLRRRQFYSGIVLATTGNIVQEECLRQCQLGQLEVQKTRDCCRLLWKRLKRKGFIGPKQGHLHALKLKVSPNLLTIARATRQMGSSRMFGVDLSRPIVSDEDSAFYMLDDGETGVWVFQSVVPSDLSSRGLASWISTVVNGLLTLEAGGARNLLIDVSRNGGGVILPIPQHTFVEYDIRLSPTMSFLSRNADAPSTTGSSSATYFSTGDLRSVNGSPSILDPGRTFTRGGSESTYSNQFEYTTCKDFTRQFLESVPRLERGWRAENVVFVSDGVCGSTCAESVRALRDGRNVRSVVYGGRTGTSFQPTSYEGGVVAQFGEILSDATSVSTRANTSRPRNPLPQPFLLPALGSIPIWECYSPAGQMNDVPAEFVPQRAERLVVVRDPLDRARVWEAFAEGLRTGGVRPIRLRKREKN
ncbi:hypothetical protein BC829DRAFT_390740 [Chytridium lagenaria]|nr:hypothetical protein BC829DRAFT_390740 [Chytridium lagenaria]